MKYKLVPEEPTEEMCKAAIYDTGDDCGSAFPSDYESTIENYKSMLAAAPSPPAQDGMSEREKELVAAIKDILEHNDGISAASYRDGNACAGPHMAWETKNRFIRVRKAIAAYEEKETP